MWNVGSGRVSDFDSTMLSPMDIIIIMDEMDRITGHVFLNKCLFGIIQWNTIDIMAVHCVFCAQW